MGGSKRNAYKAGHPKGCTREPALYHQCEILRHKVREEGKFAPIGGTAGIPPMAKNK
jgi:hypothetical protein